MLVASYSATDSPRFNFFGAGFVAGDGDSAVTCAHVVPPDAAAEANRSMVVHVWAELRGINSITKDVLHDLAMLRFVGAAAAPLTVAAGDLVREGQNA